MGSGHRLPLPLSLLLLLPLTARYASAQSTPSGNPAPYAATNFNPSMAIIIVVLISAFFFLGFFSIYMRQCSRDQRDSARGTTVLSPNPGRSRRPRGLDPEVLASFPTLVYSDVKDHKIGKGSLECAVCLSEFDDDETLRLLPQCSHVFHSDCIDAWLSAHVTCPVCRHDLAEPVAKPDQDPEELRQSDLLQADPEPALPAQEQDQVGIEIESLEQFVNMKRAKSRARPARFPRSHSTGHSLVLPGENLERYTLRLPENIRREIVQRAERLERTRSLVVFPRDGSTRGGGMKSARLGRSDRWGSLLLRTLPNWGRRSARGESDGGSLKRGDSVKGGGEGSTKRFNPMIGPFDCYGGGGGGKNDSLGVKGDDDSNLSTAALNRV